MLNIQGKTYITIAEASKLTGYHPSHIQKLATENKIEAAKIVRTWAVNQDSIIEYKESEKRQKRPSKAEKINSLNMYQKAFKLNKLATDQLHLVFVSYLAQTVCPLKIISVFRGSISFLKLSS